MQHKEFLKLACLLLIIKVENCKPQGTVRDRIKMLRERISVLQERIRDTKNELIECEYDVPRKETRNKECEKKLKECEDKAKISPESVSNLEKTEECNREIRDLQIAAGRLQRERAQLAFKTESCENGKPLNEKDIKILKDQIEKCKLKLETCQKNVNDQIEKNKKCRDEKDTIQHDIDVLKTQVQEEERRYEHCEFDKGKIEKEKADIEAKIVTAKEEKQKCEADIKQKDAEIKRLQTELDDLEKEIRQPQPDREKKKKEELEKKVNAEREETKKCKEKEKQKDEEIERLRRELEKRKQETPKVEQEEGKATNVFKSPLSDALEVIKAFKVGMAKKMHCLLDNLKVRGTSNNRRAART